MWRACGRRSRRCRRTTADAIDTELLIRRDGSVLAVRFVY
jgi:hypothetical protein